MWLASELVRVIMGLFFFASVGFGAGLGFLGVACSSWIFGRLFRFVRVVPVGLCSSSPVAWGVL